MAARFWVGGAGNWDASTTTHWAATSGGASGASVPTSADTVTFDSLSNATAYTVTITAGANCSDLTIGPPAAGAITFAGTTNLNVFGNLVTGSTTVRTYTGTLTFASTTTGKTITSNGITWGGGVSFQGTGGGWQLQDAFSSGIQTITLGAGALDTNGKTVTSGSFSNNGSGVRSLTLGATTWNCGGGGWLTGGSNFTLTAGTSTLAVTGASFTGGAKTYNVVNITSGSIAIDSGNTFATFTYTGSAVKTNTLTFAGANTFTTQFSVTGNSAINRVLVSSATYGTAVTLTAAAVTVDKADFRDITGAGAASWNMSAAAGFTGDCGNNTMQALGSTAFTTASTQHWLNASSSTWSTVGNWTSRVPLPQDTAVIDKAMGTSQTITFDMPRVGSIDFTGATWTTALTFNYTAVMEIYGNLTLISGLTITSGTFLMTFKGKGSVTIDTKGASMDHNITLDMIGGTLTLNSLVTLGPTANRNFVLTNGTLTGTTFGLKCGSITTSVTNVRVWNMGSATWECVGNTASQLAVSFFGFGSGLTINPGTSTIKITDTSATQMFFAGGGKTYNNIWWARGTSAAINSIEDSNTFNDFKDDGSVAHQIQFTAGTATHVTTFTVTGSSGAAITISSSSTASHSLIKNGAGVISCDWLNIQHSVATPASTWYAGANSVNNQAVATVGSGWIFTTPPVPPIPDFLFQSPRQQAVNRAGTY